VSLWIIVSPIGSILGAQSWKIWFSICRNEFDAIQSDTLKNLVVETCSSRIADVLVIRAPCLTSLSLNFPYICYRNGLSLEAGNSLVMASISVESDGSSQSYQTMILGNLWNVTSLDLKGFGAMAFLDKELDKFPIFDNLRTLSLSRCFLSEHDVHTFKALGRFLQKSPNLEKLSLQDFWVGVLNIFTFIYYSTLSLWLLMTCVKFSLSFVLLKVL